MSVWLLALLVLAAAIFTLCFWGAGIILHPPNMSKVETFPEQFGLRYEKVWFKTRDGLTLKGWFIPSPNGPEEERTLLMCHGWGDNKGDLIKISHFLNSQAGFNLFFFDFRSHGESDGEITTIGCLETIDFDAAVSYLRAQRKRCLKRLGVFGLSMGASVSIVSMPEHPEIKCAVLESPFADYRAVVRQWAWNAFGVPYFPLVQLTLGLLRLRVGDPKVDSFRPISSINKIAPRPLLLIGGTDDALMPERVVRSLYDAAKEPRQLWIVSGARHAKCHEIAGFEYETRVAGFFNRHL